MRWYGPYFFLEICCAIAVLTIATVGQTGGSQECVAQGALIYSPGQDHVKAPRLEVMHPLSGKPANPASRVVFDVVINSAGRICEIHVVNAPDHETARRFGHYVGDNFRFSPAMRQGKPVAARFRIVFDAAGKVSTGNSSSTK